MTVGNVLNGTFDKLMWRILAAGWTLSMMFGGWIMYSNSQVLQEIKVDLKVVKNEVVDGIRERTQIGTDVRELKRRMDKSGY